MSTHNIKCLARAGQTTCAVLRPFLKKTSPPQTHQQTCCARQRWRNGPRTIHRLPSTTLGKEKKRKETPHRHYNMSVARTSAGSRTISGDFAGTATTAEQP